MKSEFKVLLFNDVKGSSKLWKYYDKYMYDAIKKYIEISKNLINKYNGVIIKFVGDSFYMSFDTLKEAILFTFDFNLHLKRYPIIIGDKKKEKIQFRTGICYGQVKKLKYNFNKCNLIDYIGNIANAASRMESEVSEINGLAVGIINYNQDEINNIIDIYKSNKKYSNNWNYEMKYFTDKCKINRTKRSMKLLHDVSIKCDNLDKLKGIDRIYTINFVPNF